MPRLRLFVAAALLPALGLPSPACAQGYLGLDATLSSPYVWRGVTRANGWVAQPEGFVSVKAGGGFLAAGAWASYELGHAGPDDLSDLGLGHAGLVELNYWGQATWSLGLVQAALGGMRYTFRGTAPDAGRTRADNTTELYLDLRATSKYIVSGEICTRDVWFRPTDRCCGSNDSWGSAGTPWRGTTTASSRSAPCARSAVGATCGRRAGTTGARRSVPGRARGTSGAARVDRGPGGVLKGA